MSIWVQLALVWLIGAVYSALFIWLFRDVEIVPPSDEELWWILVLAASCTF